MKIFASSVKAAGLWKKPMRLDFQVHFQVEMTLGKGSRVAGI